MSLTDIQPPQRMLAGIYAALFDNSSSSARTAPSCPAGNCDFPTYQSLAVCSSCTDMTNKLESHCRLDVCTRESLEYDYRGDNQTYTNTICEHSLPGGQMLNVTNSTLSNPLTGLLSVTGPDTYPLSECTVLFNRTAIMVPPGNDVSNATATTCSLHWCVDTYSSGEKNNTPYDIITNTWNDPNPPCSSTGSINPNAWHDPTDPDTKTLPIGSQEEANITSFLQPPASENLTASKFRLKTGPQIFRVWLDGQMLMNDSQISICGEAVGVPNGTIFSDALFHRPMLEYGMEGFYSRIADGMTAAARAMDNVSSYANWTSYQMVTQVHVQWCWVILPSCLVVMSAVYLGLTIHQTNQHGLDVWKSSPTPLIAFIDGGIQTELRSADGLVPMEKTANQVRVKFEKDDIDNEWKLKVL